MSDAWSIQISGDVSSMGWTTVVSSTAGREPSNFAARGEIISTSVNNIHFIPENTKTYSEAKNLIEQGSRTALLNKEPIVYVSLPANRQDTWGYFSESFKFPNLYVKTASDDFGLGGWTALGIIDQLKFGVPFTYDSAFWSFNYDISYYRVAAYGNLMQEFSTLMAGLPIVWKFDSSGGIQAKLAPFMSTSPQLDTGNITVKFIPKKKPCIIVYGGWGPPSSDSNAQAPTGAYVKTAVLPQQSDVPIYWGRSLPAFSSDATSGGLIIDDGALVDISKLITGKLDIFAKNIDSSYIKQVDVNVNNSTQGFQAELDIDMSRTEVLAAGMPLFTLVSTTESKKETAYMYDQSGDSNRVVGETTITVTANVGSLISGGENALDLHPVTQYIVHTNLTPAMLLDIEGGVPSYKLVVSSLSITYTTYEDMFSSDRKVISANSQTPTNAAVGRKLMEETFMFRLFLQDSEEFLSGKRTGVDPVGFGPMNINSRSLDKNKAILYVTNIQRIQYSPMGATGFSRSIHTLTYDPITGGASVDAKDGSGDSGQYLSQLQFGPGACRVKAYAGDGDPEQINLGFCSSWDKAEDYADNALGYRGSYYEITATTQKTACPDIDFSYPSEIPGNNGDYGLIMSVSKNITPTKSFKTVVYRYYE
jgi:hypothetical protein